MWTELHASQSQKLNYPPAHVPPIFTLMQLLTYLSPFLKLYFTLTANFSFNCILFSCFHFFLLFFSFYIFALMLSSDSSSGFFSNVHTVHTTLSVPTV
jgi:hypothetical protein